MEMVKYWKTNDRVQAIVTKKDGAQVMQMDGEKYPFPGYPRGHLLYGPLSKLKHEIKVQLFNESWWELEDGVPRETVRENIKHKLPNVAQWVAPLQYDILPKEKMCPPVRELYRAWSKVNPNSIWKEIVCLILQEDDAYRFRFQWMIPFMGFGSPQKKLDKGFEWMEHGEVIDDMKERVRLVRRILGLILEDPENDTFVKALFKEINWNKIKMSKADKYFFRAKYFKVDLDLFEY